MSISVLIPVFKGSQTLAKTLASITSQKITPDEVIIADDTPRTDQQEVKKINTIVGRFKKKAHVSVIFIKNKKNLGCQKNFQLLTNKAKSNILLFLAQDDILSKNTIKKVTEVFTKYPQIGFMTRPYYWFYDDVQKPIRHVPPPDLENDTLLNITDSRSFSPLFGSIGQISGLAMKKKWIIEPFHDDIFSGHIYPIVCMWKQHPGIFIKDYIVAIGTKTSQSRTHSAYNSSPTKQWIKMFTYCFNEKKYNHLIQRGIDHISTHYVGLVQIKNYAGQKKIFKEIYILLKYRWKNIFSLAFWGYSILTLLTPQSILRKITDWYKQIVLSSTMPKINFD